MAPTGGLDLENASTRGRVVTGVRSALGDGFDGVHFDFEPVGDEDPGYLALLDEAGPVVRAAGRAAFRTEDLLALTELVARLAAAHR